jgi:polyisoprenoid-binding protein YceI
MSGRYIVDGNLTIKGITNPVTFEISLYKENTYRATLVFDRSKFDVRYGSDSFFDNLGDRVILNEIELVVDLVIM